MAEQKFKPCLFDSRPLPNKASYQVKFVVSLVLLLRIRLSLRNKGSARFGSTYTKIGTIQRRLAWPLRKDDTQIHEAFHIFKWIKCIQNCIIKKRKKERDCQKNKNKFQCWDLLSTRERYQGLALRFRFTNIWIGHDHSEPSMLGHESLL